MTPKVVAQLRIHLASAPDVLQGSPVDLATIAAAQQQLNVTFSQDYIEFLQLFGCSVVGAYPVFGLGRNLTR